MVEATVPLYVRIPGELRQKVDDFCYREKKTLTEVVMEALERYVEERQERIGDRGTDS